MEPLEDQVVEIGEILEYDLPSIFDLESDSTTISYDLGEASTFTTYSSNIFYFNPTSVNLVGNYTLSVTLTDSGINSLSSEYTF